MIIESPEASTKAVSAFERRSKPTLPRNSFSAGSGQATCRHTFANQNFFAKVAGHIFS